MTCYYFLAPQVGSTALRASLCSVTPLHTPLRWGVTFYGRPRPNQQPFRLLVATYRLVVTSEIQSPGCSRPTDKTNKKTDTRIMLYFWVLDSPSGPRRENSPQDCFLIPPFSRRSTRAPPSPTPS